MMSSQRSKSQRKVPKSLPESEAMQSEVEGFKEVVYAELFSEAPSPARSPKKAKPGPLSRKLRLEKKKMSAMAQPETNGTHESDTNGTHDNETNANQIAETNGSQMVETNGSHVAETNGTSLVEIQEPQVPEPRMQEPVAPTEFLPTELFEPSAQEPFAECLPEEPSCLSELDDSFASTAVLADQSVATVEICVSPSAFPLDESQPSVLEQTAPVEESEPEAWKPTPAEAPLPVPAAPPVRQFRETPRDYRGFLSVSSRPSIRESTPTTSTPQSFLRCRDDPATPFVWGKRKAEEDTENEAKRAKAAEGFFARVTAPLYRAFAHKEIEEDEGIEAGVEVVEQGQPRKYCVVM